VPPKPVPPAPPKPTTPPPAPSAPPKDNKLSTYLMGKSNLRQAKEAAETELKRLQAAILSRAADEPFLKEIETKSKKLFEFTAVFDNGLSDKVGEAGTNPDPEQRATLDKKLLEMIRAQSTTLRNHPMASFVDTNPFGTFQVSQPLLQSLSTLEKQLA
jgi:hypothetical protein